MEIIQREVEGRMDFEISNLPDDYLILSLGADERAIKPLKLYGREMLTPIGLKRAADEK
uniref:Uncharacterized protein n=1 Tax=Candidatus Methanophaga sp. ANME-1 ERB7 TaxID=2759913 RepID=A0A7G9Z680_9EURY|nr:hypothetical protein HKFFHJMH_00014 [Methanosarcinales archaeon ANME-1 ERB7]